MEEAEARSYISDYLKSVEKPRRAALERICAIVKATVPESVEGISYGLPAYKYKDRPLFGFAASKEHLGIYPFSPKVIDAVRGNLNNFDYSKGAVKFTESHELPEDLLVAMILLRKAELDKVH